MVMQLGQTSDPVELIPGDPGSVALVAGQMYDYSALLTEAGNGLSRIDTADGWSGAAADAFRARFKGQPGAWLEAGACFKEAAEALDGYVPALVWAQQEAGTAIDLWYHGDKKSAQATLDNAQSQLEAAANRASAAVGTARDKAPQAPGFWSDVGHFFSDLGHDAEQAGATALDALASLGNAAIQNPLADLGMVGGTMLAGVSAIGDGAGFVLDATGVGAVAGVPLNVVSTAGVVAGTGLMMASGDDLVSHALGDDRVDPINTSGGSGDSPSSPDPRLTPGTAEYDQYISELAQDPANNGAIRPASVREATVAVQAEADGEIPGPLSRTPFDEAGTDQGDFTDATGQRWEVKSSPDIRPSYRPSAGQPIDNPQTTERFTDMINDELAKGQKVLLDPDGMTPARLAQLEQVVAAHPEWLGQVIWGT
jgi:hypothetical protein